MSCLTYTVYNSNTVYGMFKDFVDFSILKDAQPGFFLMVLQGREHLTYWPGWLFYELVCSYDLSTTETPKNRQIVGHDFR